MSIYLYDKSVVDVMRTWNRDNIISITSTDVLFPFRADASGTDRVTLPAISMSRLGVELLANSKRPMNADGYAYRVESDRTGKLRSVPIRIRWQLDIYTKNRQENDNLVREIILKLIAQPTFEIPIPYNNADISHKFNVHIAPDIVDNSQIPEHLEVGEYFRSTLEIYTDDAYLFNYVIRDNTGLEIEIKLDQENN